MKMTDENKRLLATLIERFVNVVPSTWQAEQAPITQQALAEVLVCNIMAELKIEFNETFITECARQTQHAIRHSIIPNELLRVSRRAERAERVREQDIAERRRLTDESRHPSDNASLYERAG
jgi:hypothetical protein